MTVAVVILTYNEEIHLTRALQSVASFADEVFVVDSLSTDRTVEIARAHGAHVLQREFDNQSRQLNWALETAPIQSDWIFRLDADEVVENDLAATIRRDLSRLPDDVVGVNLKRKHIFLGRWIRHGGRYPLVLLRIWRRGRGRVEDRWMDEHVVVSGGRIITFEGGFADHNMQDLTFFIDKHNKYATREAIEQINLKYRLFSRSETLAAGRMPTQAIFKRFIKEQVYYYLPFWLGPFGYFAYRYFIQLGFLDGRPGLIYHVLQGGWYRFLVAAKVLEYDGRLAKCTCNDERLDLLEMLTGQRLRTTNSE